MAARFLFQKFPSGMSGSKRLLRSCVSASASAGAQVTHAASAFVDSVGGEKRAFSSDVFTRNRISRKAKMATWAAEWDAKSAAWQAQQSSWKAEIEAKTADSNKFVRAQACLWGCTCFCWIFGDFLEDCARSYNSKSSSTHASSCGN